MLAAVLVVTGCEAHRTGGDEGLTDRGPDRLEEDQRRRLRTCVLAAAERSRAEHDDPNVTGAVDAARNAVRTSGSLADRIELLRLRFGIRGLEVEGRARRAADAVALHRRLDARRELPTVHLRELRGNDADGYEFRLIETRLRELRARAPDLEKVYTRAREMGVEPVERDVCPERLDGSERLRRRPPGRWERVVRDIPGGWRLSGFETSAPAESSTGSGLLYDLAEDADSWHGVSVEFGGGEMRLRVADLIPDPGGGYRTPPDLPEKVRALARSRGVESWAAFDSCPRELCGFDVSGDDSIDRGALEYLTTLVRRVDRRRAQLYDLEATGWLAQFGAAGVSCSGELLRSDAAVERLSFGVEGRLRARLDDDRAGRGRKAFRRCPGSLLRGPRDSSADTLAASLAGPDEFNPDVERIEPSWARRDFVDGASQLEYLVRRRKTSEVARTLERLRKRLHRSESKFFAPRAHLESVADTLLAASFADVEVAPIAPVELAPDIDYHRVVLRAGASRRAAAQFFALFGQLQRDRLVLLERAEWRSGSETPTLEATFGVLSQG